MALKFGGNSVSSLRYNGTNVIAAFFDGTQVFGPSGSQTYSTPGSYTFTVPSGVYSLNVCMIGGGGSGGATASLNAAYAGGGYAGAIVSDTLEVEPGDTIAVTVGTGAIGVYSADGSDKYGLAGSTTSFGSLAAAGGAGGTWATTDAVVYKGNGAPRSTCIGTTTDGLLAGATGRLAYGGQAGLAAGGNGRVGNDIAAYPGSMGSGGGGAATNSGSVGTRSGNGGNGYVKITWGID